MRTAQRSGTSHRSRAPTVANGQADHSRLLSAVVGAYQLEGVVAAGGFGAVYRARGPGGDPVAIKVLHGEHAAAERSLARFEREIETLRAIRHPNVVDVVAVGRLPDGRPYYAMELLAGEDLDAVVRRRGRLGEREVADILAPLCDALAAVHDRGIVHRDVKPSNVFVCDSGRVVLLDFGVAKLLGGEAGLTGSRQTLGTPSFMAPEQAAGLPVDARTDVYALGVVAYFALTGRAPFAHESPTIVSYLHQHARRQRPSLAAEVSPAVDEVIVRAMRAEPADRFPDARALAAALRRAVDGDGDAPGPRAERPALAVHVEVAAADVAALDDVAAVLAAAERYLCARGFAVVVEGSQSLLLVHPEVDRARGAAAGFRRWLARSPRSARVRAAVAECAGTVEYTGDRVTGGELLARVGAP